MLALRAYKVYMIGASPSGTISAGVESCEEIVGDFYFRQWILSRRSARCFLCAGCGGLGLALVTVIVKPTSKSELQRNSAPLSPKYPKHERISRLFLDKPDCRECTARQRRGHCRRFSPDGTCAVRFPLGRKGMRCDHKPGIRPQRVDLLASGRPI